MVREIARDIVCYRLLLQAEPLDTRYVKDWQNGHGSDMVCGDRSIPISEGQYNIIADVQQFDSASFSSPRG
jgi:hypothetical protein